MPGYKVDRFEVEPDMKFLCLICKCVHLTPASISKCGHVFCFSCIRKRLRTNHSRTCPTCHGEARGKLKTPSSSYMVEYNDLRIKCSNRCGQTVTLKDLVVHERDECVHAPVLCPNKIHGCVEKIKRMNLSHHVTTCIYRPVVCEACGHKTLFCNVFTHQKRKRCLQTQLKQEMVRSVRSASREIRHHLAELKNDVMHFEVEQQKQSHLRSGCFRYRSLESRNSSRPVSRDLATRSSDTVSRSCDVTDLCHYPLTSLRSEDLLICTQCSKTFRPGAKNGNTCHWHCGPILQHLFGGYVGIVAA